VKPDDFDQIITLAAGALQAAVDEDYDTALAKVGEVIEAHELNGLYLLLTAFADWSVQAQSQARGRKPPQGGVKSAPAWLDPDTGTLTTDAAGVGDAERWAGQFLAARAAMDHDMTKALALALPNQCGKHVQALVETCAASVQALQEAS
jgi:hypothetical protein